MNNPAELFDASRRRLFRGRLLRWFGRHARELPWRGTRDPYAVWLSEIMLQQTQVATVVGYYKRFLSRFPTVGALARADEQEVLRLWEGLGYYRRARQFHQAARIVVAEHGGQFPRDVETVRRLPGIGRYTAGAILSIAFDVRLPIVEANTRRLLSRLAAYRGDPASGGGERLLWHFAELLLPRKRTGRFNQAMMELGGGICMPQKPRCEQCPVATLCEARRLGLQADIPRPKPPAALTPRREAAVLLRRRGRVLLLRCPDGGRWAGLWDFPRVALECEKPAERRRELAEKVRDLTGVAIEPGELLHTIRHGVTRYRITLECYAARCLSLGSPPDGATLKWLRADELAQYPLSTTGRKLARLASAAHRAQRTTPATAPCPPATGGAWLRRRRW